MTTALIRLAGPAQSWAGPRVTADIIPTELVPTRPALIGMVSAGLGLTRDEEPPSWLTDARITARVDRRGYVYTDYHTVNPAPEHLGHHYQRLELAAGRVKARSGPQTMYVTKGNGERWKIGKGASNVITRRKFLAYAEFIVAVSVAEPYTADLWQALRAPRFCTYLGRKNFAPEFPYLLGQSPHDDHTTVLSTIPAVVPSSTDTTDTENTATVTRFAHPITGYRNTAREPLTVPAVTTRKDQLAWLQHSLTR